VKAAERLDNLAAVADEQSGLLQHHLRARLVGGDEVRRGDAGEREEVLNRFGVVDSRIGEDAVEEAMLLVRW